MSARKCEWAASNNSCDYNKHKNNNGKLYLAAVRSSRHSRDKKAIASRGRRGPEESPYFFSTANIYGPRRKCVHAGAERASSAAHRPYASARPTKFIYVMPLTWLIEFISRNINIIRFGSHTVRGAHAVH